MANEPQREIEKDLLAYKQRRREQAGPPLDIHPATRKMLQSEAARAASRPLLTSEEAAKNFVRSFVMSHQQAGFFTRHKQRVIWGGAMFACLAVVLAVLRNDPRLAEQQRAFPDTLPSPPQVSDPQPARPQSTTTANKPQAGSGQLARARQSAPVADKLQEPRGNSPAHATARGAIVASAPVPASTGPASTTGPAVAKAEKIEPGQTAQPAKALKLTQAAGAESKFRLNDELKNATKVPVAGGGGAALASQRFLQLDNRAGFRQNFNSPPVPQVMQDFAFERVGERVRIVDADGSTYEGAVMPAPAHESRAKGVSQPDVAQASYRFFASGVNRKLNQSVEVRGEWQPSAPPKTAQTPALQTTSFSGVRLEAQTVERKEKFSATNALSSSAGPAQTHQFQHSKMDLSSGRISGRAVVGGKNEFDINAVPK
ncbi:MAG: hypothetical protein HZA92_20150 [Verrucomicrobia bacterium]|nr:hypothetical protein [Verrucomicrobiota bacterium]